MVGQLDGARSEASVRSANGIEFLTWPALEDAGVDVVVTTREGGVSSGPYASLNLGLHVGDDERVVVENRRRALGTFDASLDELVLGAQVHGSNTVVVGAADAGRGARNAAGAVPDTDALVTKATGLVLGALVADCSPIVLVDPEARVLATVHAGWRGTAAGVTAEALSVMCSIGARAERVVAGIGPTVAPGSYEVGPEVAAAVQRRLEVAAPGAPEHRYVLTPSSRGKWLLDVAGANRAELLAAGVPAAQVFTSPLATNDARFYSYRSQGRCGRFALLARLR